MECLQSDTGLEWARDTVQRRRDDSIVQNVIFDIIIIRIRRYETRDRYRDRTLR